MNANSKTQPMILDRPRQTSAEQKLKELGIPLPSPPQPFGSYVEAVQSGKLVFLSEVTG